MGAWHKHRRLGPGLLESIHTERLCWELRNSGMPRAREVPQTVVDEDMRLTSAYRADIIVAHEAILEINTRGPKSRRLNRNARTGDITPLPLAGLSREADQDRRAQRGG